MSAAHAAEGARRHSYDSGTADRPLLAGTIGDALHRAVRDHGDCEALVDRASGTRLTYGGLAEEVDAASRALLGLGVARGDRVALWAHNRWEWVVVQYATAGIGAVLVNVNPAYGSGELSYVLERTETRVLFAAAAEHGDDYADVAEEVRRGIPALEHVVLLDEGWHRFLEAGRGVSHTDLARAQERLDQDDPVNIQFTSGTTGSPKGATLSHHSILNNGFSVGELLGYTQEDRVCLPVPFFHCFGMVMGSLAALTHGSCVVVPGPRFNASTALDAVEEERCTSLYGVPTMFIAELADPGFDERDLSSLRTGIMSGTPCPVEVMHQVIERMAMSEVAICYGMTETSPVLTQTRADDPVERRVSTVGRAGPHVEIKVVDPETGRMVPRGVAGELCARGYSVMLGYWGEPERTAEVIDTGRWMHTGDIATMDDDGYVSITGRIKDMVIRGGENVYPREVEEFLHTHPDVLDVQVIGVPDRRYGEELMACLRMRPGSEPLTADDLRRFCEGRLARFKIPRYVRIVDAYPMTASGKVRKTRLREEAVALLGFDAQLAS
ncbi:AMP-binding protein [Nocardiopsis quinghaiensis]|uniref:AMP-binding protein n=1 Tax=Nocardiopsis quinghaiensis TaxID=464995 RepID=UPI00123985C4|nr:AMP-binding protein [Nocardiopsis quinghaiensis]